MRVSASVLCVCVCVCVCVWVGACVCVCVCVVGVRAQRAHFTHTYLNTEHLATPKQRIRQNREPRDTQQRPTFVS
jgi:hypothetical protein